MFGGFKASLNLFGKRNKKGIHSELSPDMTVSGAYRTSRDDSFGYNNSFDQPKKATPSEQLLQQIRPTKSATDLTKVRNVLPHLRHSTVEVSRDPRGASQEDPRIVAQNAKITKLQEKEQKRLEKQRMAEKKARDKLAAQEQAKQEKLRKEREKREMPPSRPKRERKPDRKKAAAPQPQGVPAPPPPPPAQQYSTNTLESSISRSSGPPPYSDVPRGPDTSGNVPSASNSTNVSYSKPVDTGSWDMVSQHRQQTIRPTAVIGGGGPKKQMVMDLNYNFGQASETKENSEA